MSGTKITNAVYLDSDWQNEIETKNILKLGWMNLQFTTSTTVNYIYAGSTIEVNGVIYKFTANDTVSTSGMNDGQNYLYVSESGGVLVTSFSNINPTYNPLKRGYYDGTGLKRCFLVLTKTLNQFTGKQLAKDSDYLKTAIGQKGGAVGIESTAGDGFSGGWSAYTTTGGSAGSDALSASGFSGGANTSTNSGGSVGNGATSTSGFAGGNLANVTTGGAIGDGASVTTGGSCGANADATTGFAGGAGAQASTGVALGPGAVAVGNTHAVGATTTQYLISNVWDKMKLFFFPSNTPQLTVFTALTASPTCVPVNAYSYIIGRIGSLPVDKVLNNNGTSLEFSDVNNTLILTVTAGSGTSIGQELRVLFLC